MTGVALGPATVSVGGRLVSTEHTRLTFTYAGDLRGTNPTDFWVVPSTGLIVREQEAVGVTQGGVGYSETMLATLTRLGPVR
jgi:hypothetical protein